MNVRFVPDLKRNLISVGSLDASGCVVKIDKGVIKVINEGFNQEWFVCS